MRRIIIGASIITSTLCTTVLAKMAWSKVGRHDSIIGERYSLLMRSAKTDEDKVKVEALYETEKQMEALGEILAYHRRRRTSCNDLCDKENKMVQKFNDIEASLNEELRIISRGL